MKKIIVLVMMVMMLVAVVVGVDSDTVLLLHNDGDESFPGHSVNYNGNPVLTDDAMFGQAGYFDGSGDYLSIPDSSDWEFTGDFTIDGWVKPDLSQTFYVFANTNTGVGRKGIRLYIHSNGFIGAHAGTTDVANDIIHIETANGMVQSNTWNHIAYVRDSNVATIYLNGRKIGEDTSASGTIPQNGILAIGYMQSSGTPYYAKGTLDEFRISKGIVRWTGNFTPPTSAYTSDTDTKLLIHFDGDEGETIFSDSSSSAHTVTTVGDTLKTGLPDEFNDAIEFDGDTDYVSIPMSNDWAFGTENFTIDFWYFHNGHNGVAGIKRILGTYPAGTASWDLYDWGIVYSTVSGQLSFVSGDYYSDRQIFSGPVLPVDKWNHITVVREGLGAGQTKMYLNGQLAGSGTISRTIGSRYNLYFMAPISYVGEESPKGLLDEVRISKGVARWTSAFTPPTSPHTVDSDTKLLLSMDGDESLYNHEVTFNGDIMNSDTSLDGFGESGHLDGVGDYLSIPDSDDWTIESNDYTVDLWVRHDDIRGTAAYSAASTYVYATHYIDDNNRWALQHGWDGGSNIGLSFGVLSGGSWSLYMIGPGTSAEINDHDWHHIAISKDGNTWNLFLDGKIVKTASYAGAGTSLTNNFLIGKIGHSSLTYAMNGEMDELRVSKGIARWTGNFTPSTEPYTTDANTKLLMHFDGEEGNASFIDSSSSTHTITTVGDVHITGLGDEFEDAFYFDGSGDYLSLADSSSWDFGTGDFTIDTWVKIDDIETRNALFGQWNAGVNERNVMLEYRGDLVPNSVRILTSDLGSNNQDTYLDWNPVPNTWYHLALVRVGISFKLYIDGNYIGVHTGPSNLFDANALFYVGDGDVSGADPLAGSMDEVRVSKGIARWTSNFTPDTTPYSGLNLPIYTSFESTISTTNFSEVSDVTNVTNVTLGISGKGKIQFGLSHGINAEGENYDVNVFIDNGMIFVNTSALHSTFNSSATLTFYSADCNKPYVYYSETKSTFAGIIGENVRCLAPLCTNIQCSSGTLSVDVAHFTGYASGTNANLTIWADAGVYYENETVPFYASYINSTDGNSISGECNISFDDAWGTWFEMDYNGNQYNYSRLFLAGTHEYNVTCYNSSYNTLEANDSKYIFAAGTPIPEFSIMTLGIGLFAVLVGLVLIRRRR